MTVVSLDVSGIQAAAAAAGRVAARLASGSAAVSGSARGSAMAPLARDISALLTAERDASAAVASAVGLFERHLRATGGAAVDADRFTV